MMQLLRLLVGCAKLVAAIVLLISGLGLIRFVSLKCRGLLPSVAATAFVISIITANIKELYGIFALFVVRLASLIYSFSGGITHLIFVFAILLCCAIATRLVLSERRLSDLIKKLRKTDGPLRTQCGLSNSYLAITPVLLS